MRLTRIWRRHRPGRIAGRLRCRRVFTLTTLTTPRHTKLVIVPRFLDEDAPVKLIYRCLPYADCEIDLQHFPDDFVVEICNDYKYVNFQIKF